MSAKKVYLAGGMRTDWREKVKSVITTPVVWLDPTTHGIKDEIGYTAWDLGAITDCDILFGYFEASNPYGHGLMLELGFAFGIGKPITYVDERQDIQKYTGMARSVSSAHFSDLTWGLAYLRRHLEDKLV